MLLYAFLTTLLLCVTCCDTFKLSHSVNLIDQSIERMYTKSFKIKCPFFKRRLQDMLDCSSLILQFLVKRHKSISWLFDANDTTCITPPGTAGVVGEEKLVGLSVEEISKIILSDWKTHSNKGYYITGLLTKSIYRDNCLFDGPDPDMPVRGLRKYLSASSQLFDRRVSCATLCDIQHSTENRTIVVKWTLEGVLNLPWHPTICPLRGNTKYILDKSGLIERHIEEWEVSTLVAFWSTLFPS